MLPDAGFTSFAIATACGIPSSTNKASAPLPAFLKPAANSPSEPGSNAPVCTGPWPAPTKSSLYGAVVSAVGLKTSGNAETILSPPDFHFRAPARKHANVQHGLAEHPRFHIHYTPTSGSW